MLIKSPQRADLIIIKYTKINKDHYLLTHNVGNVEILNFAYV
jgi:hypothetical protein